MTPTPRRRALSAAQRTGLQWTGLLALCVGLSQFDKGLALAYSKWNADVLAGEAKTLAVEVRTEFDTYLQQQQKAYEVQAAYTRAQNEFNDRLLDLQQHQQDQQDQTQRPVPTTRVWNSEYGRWMCCDEAPSTCDQAASWYWCSE